MGVVAFTRSATAASARIHSVSTVQIKEKSLVAANVFQRLALTRPEKLELLISIARKYLHESPPR